MEIWEAWWHLLLNVLVAINSFVNNPGVAIILFTFLIRCLTIPLTVKALKSSRNMQQIQPLIKEVQKKYGKDKAKQQEETMKIYQQYGVNPAAGCFPMLVQIPVFLGLYSALDFILKHGSETAGLASILFNDQWVPYANFSHPFFWVANLAIADPIFVWPVLSGIFQFFQSRMSIPIRDPNQPMDPQMKMMNNMMQFMPIYITVISLGFPAGTVVYWAMSNLFGAVQQYFITGWGSLPTLPGFGWLPRKPIGSLTPPPPPDPSTIPAKKRGVMTWMMDKALTAQEAQKSAQAQADTNGSTSGGGSSIGTYAPVARPKGKGKGKSNDQQVKIVPTTTMKYASDLKYRERDTENGAHDHHDDDRFSVSTAQLPRKKRSKK